MAFGDILLASRYLPQQVRACAGRKLAA